MDACKHACMVPRPSWKIALVFIIIKTVTSPHSAHFISACSVVAASKGRPEVEVAAELLADGAEPAAATRSQYEAQAASSAFSVASSPLHTTAI